MNETNFNKLSFLFRCYPFTFNKSTEDWQRCATMINSFRYLTQDDREVFQFSSHLMGLLFHEVSIEGDCG